MGSVGGTVDGVCGRTVDRVCSWDNGRGLRGDGGQGLRGDGRALERVRQGQAPRRAAVPTLPVRASTKRGTGVSHCWPSPAGTGQSRWPSLTFSSFSKCSRRNFMGLSGLEMHRCTMQSLRTC